MKPFLALLIACFLVPIHLMGQSDDGFNFSQVLGSLKYMGKQEYGSKELGYSLRYENDQLLKADIYVYDQGKTDLKDGIKSPEVLAEMKAVVEGLEEMVKMGRYKDVEVLKEDVYESHLQG